MSLKYEAASVPQHISQGCGNLKGDERPIGRGELSDDCVEDAVGGHFADVHRADLRFR